MALIKKFDIVAPNYLRVRSLGKGSMGSVSEAIPLDDPSEKVAIKLINSVREIEHDDLHRFQKEATLMSQLYHPNIITFREFGLLKNQNVDDFGQKNKGGYYIVMELAKGKNLKEILASDGRGGMSLDFFFQVAQQVASALDYTHGKDIIHRDIKPQNIVIEYMSDGSSKLNAKVLDFGVAALGETRNYTGFEQSGFDDFAGTPLYMAPELNKFNDDRVDHRVDLYSLGCLLYEILAGHTPFQGSSRQTLKKLHASGKPQVLSEIRPDIPTIISDMVHKLLEKDPNDRYQTAFSIFSDLKRAEQMVSSLQTGVGMEQASAILPQLALNDRFKSAGAKLRLIGRSKEFSELKLFYNDVATKSARGRISVVSGGPGIGKSRLIKELRNYFKSRKIRFVSGNFTRYKSNVPFNALASAFDEYLLKIFRTQPLETQKLIANLKSTLGTQAYRLAHVIPSILNFLEESERPEPESDHDTNYSIFVKAFTDFTRCLMAGDQPIVFLFDDLHNADEKSLHLIDQFFTYNNSQRIYLIVSCQNTGFYNNPLFDKFLLKVSRLKRRYQRLELGSLGFDDVKNLFEHMLASRLNSTFDEVVDLVHKSSNGNPVHIVEKVRDFVVNGEIRQDFSSRRWVFDIDELRRVKRPLLNIDLALSIVATYEVEQRTVMEIAATAGNSFRFEMLSCIPTVTSSEIIYTMERALSDGLIEKFSDSGDLEHFGTPYRFVHRSMRQTIYDSIENKKKCDIHLALGNLIDRLTKNYDTQIIFSIAHHLNQAVHELARGNDEDFRNCLAMNLRAADLSCAQGSLPSSVKYYRNALKIIKLKPNFDIHTDQYLMIYEKIAIIQIKQGRFREAVSSLNSILNVRGNNILKSRHTKIYKNVMDLYISIHLKDGKITRAHEITLQALNRIEGGSNKIHFFHRYVYYIYVMIDLIAIRTRIFPSFVDKILSCAKKSTCTENSALTFYCLAFEAAKYLDVNYARTIHQKSYLYALKNECTREEYLFLLINRAEIFSRFKFKFAAGFIYKKLAKLALSINTASVVKVLASKAVNFEVRWSRNPKLVLSFRQKDYYKLFLLPRDSTLDSNMRGLSAFCFLMRGDIKRAMFDVRKGLNIVSTRSHNSPFLVLISSFIRLMKGESNGLALSSEYFIDKRVSRKSRKNDIFQLLLHALLCLVNGDFRQVKYHMKTALILFEKNNRSFDLPHQVEFACLCFALIPSFYEYSTGDAMLERDELISLFKKLSIKIRRYFSQKTTLARLVTFVNQGLIDRNISILNFKKFVYELERSKEVIYFMLGLFYYGTISQILAGRDAGRKELLISLAKSRKYRLIGFTRLVESKMEEYGFEYYRRDERSGIVNVDSRFTHFPTTLVYECLYAVSKDLHLRSFPYFFDKFANVFRSHYGGTDFHFISFRSFDDKLSGTQIYSLNGNTDHDVLLRFLEPYMDVETSLFIPCTNGDWNLNPSEENPHINMENNSIDISKRISEPKVESTVVYAYSEDTQIDNSPNSTNIKNTNAGLNSRAVTMCCLVPLFDEGQIKGIVFVEDIGEFFQSNSVESRNEIDLWASQLMCMVKQMPKIGPELAGFSINRLPHYGQGTFCIEACDWLHLWVYGRLRRDRESSWYLGFNLGDDKYVIVFCQFVGSEFVREELSFVLWCHIQTLRVHQRLPESQDTILDSFGRDCSTLIQRHRGASKLKECLFSVSVLDKTTKSVKSGHFGGSRPLVLGGINKVQPKNEAILRFESGGALYYWRVTSDLGCYLPLIVTKNRSSFEKVYEEEEIEKIRVSLAGKLSGRFTSDEMDELIVLLAGSNLLSRYYVAAVLKKVQDSECENGSRGAV